MSPHDPIIFDIIRQLRTEDIPPSYIKLAKITGRDGIERTLVGAELAEFMEAPYADHAQVIVDVDKIRKKILAEVSVVFNGVNRLFLESKQDD